MIPTSSQPYPDSGASASLVGIRIGNGPLVEMTGREYDLAEIEKALDAARLANADGDRVWSAIELSFAARGRDRLMGRRPRPIAGTVR